MNTFIEKKDYLKFRIWDIRYNEFMDMRSDILINSDGDVYRYNEVNWYVDNRDIIIERSTGIRDINRKLIYEGDIIGSEDSNGNLIKHKIEYNKDCAKFEAILLPSCDFKKYASDITKEWVQNFKKYIISNIHNVNYY